jgi:hypothetical protein
MNKITALAIVLFASGVIAAQKKEEDKFTSDFMADSCSFSTSGRNMYFILEPGYQLLLKGKDGKDSAQLIITVTKETKKVGNVDCRIVEENESVNGKTVEISRNYFAFCKETGNIFYFGEEVDIYKDGKIVKHEGAWLAEGKNKPGVAMPGSIMLGARYYQEIAPGVAMDRAENISTTETLETPAGKFTSVLKTQETTPLEKAEKEFKYYAPGIGLIKDEGLLLVKYGFVK